MLSASIERVASRLSPVAFDSYIRVSRVGKRDGYQSPDEQRRVIAAVAASKGVALGLEVVEEDVSGSRAAEERGLERLLARAERDESEGLIVAFQDRLSRGSLIETSRVWERLGRAGARLLTGDGLDSAAPGQELLFNVRAAIARDQWQRYRDGWARTCEGMVARGAHHCAQPPLGYRKGEGGRLEPSEDADRVREMFRRRVAGASHSELARWLGMSTQGVQKALRNRAYLGEARYGAAVAEGAHEPLVDRLTFDRAGASRGRGVRVSRTGAVAGGSLAAGLATCSVCGRRLASSVVRGRVQLKCLDPGHANSIMSAPLDDLVVGEVMTWRRRARGLEFERRPDLSAATAELEAREYDMRLFLDNLEAISILGREEWNRQAARHRAAAETARAALVALAGEADREATYTRLHERWEAADHGGRRAILASLVERVEVRPVNGARGVAARERAKVVLR